MLDVHGVAVTLADVGVRTPVSHVTPSSRGCGFDKTSMIGECDEAVFCDESRLFIADVDGVIEMPYSSR